MFFVLFLIVFNQDKYPMRIQEQKFGKMQSVISLKKDSHHNLSKHVRPLFRIKKPSIQLFWKLCWNWVYMNAQINARKCQIVVNLPSYVGHTILCFSSSDLFARDCQIDLSPNSGLDRMSWKECRWCACPLIRLLRDWVEFLIWLQTSLQPISRIWCSLADRIWRFFFFLNKIRTWEVQWYDVCMCGFTNDDWWAWKTLCVKYF